VSDKIKITDEDMQKYYDENMEKFTSPEKVKVSLIFVEVKDDASGELKKEKKATAEKIFKRLENGEKIDELESFVPERMASRILGMGDILTLIEKADENLDYQEQESMSRKMMSGNFNLKDFASQLGMVNKLGSLQKIARYLPGMGDISPDMMEKGQSEMKRFKAVISSMTEKERLMPSILDGSRKKRVALGAGVCVQDVNQLLQKFEQSKQFVKMLKKGGSFGKFFK